MGSTTVAFMDFAKKIKRKKKMLEIIKNRNKIERIEKLSKKTSLDIFENLNFENLNKQKHFCYRGFQNNIFFIYYYSDGIMLSGDISEEMQKIVDEEETTAVFKDAAEYV